ncbi:MAG: SDR family NAD(P)-dependent oxidoreductase [Kangiellaceae bacterium]|jgi:short-subunit dehydrogenase|nr:SDR family NAD(P)-dependent oxidoreductase [Kangiellaceae bacterium]
MSKITSYFNNKIVWITGASSGIGQATALALAEYGATLILSSRNQQKLEDVCGRCANPERHLVLPLDLESRQFDEQVSTVFQRFRHVDILLNNGGISQRALALDTAPQAMQKVFDIDFFGTVELTRQVAKRMKARQQGQIVNISSVAGKLGAPFRSSYCGAKHALIGYMDCLRTELTPYNVNVLNVCPGFVQTNVSINAINETGDNYGKMDDDVASGIPLDNFTKSLVKAIAAKKNEVVVATGLPLVATYLRRFFPNLLFKMVYSASKKGLQ